MSLNKAIKFIFVVLVLSQIIPLSVFGRGPFKANVTMIASESGFTDTEMLIYDTFVKLLKDEDLYSEYEFQIEYLIDAAKIEDTDQSIISVTCLYPLPDEVIKLNKSNEAFYLTSEDKELPYTEDAKYVREHVSGMYIEQFRMVGNNYLQLVDEDDVTEFLSRIIDDTQKK